MSKTSAALCVQTGRPVGGTGRAVFHALIAQFERAGSDTIEKYNNYLLTNRFHSSTFNFIVLNTAISPPFCSFQLLPPKLLHIYTRQNLYLFVLLPFCFIFILARQNKIPEMQQTYYNKKILKWNDFLTQFLCQAICTQGTPKGPK